MPTPPQPPPETIKDTLISIVIAFTIAFVFRGFVIEAFVIPTGSMAPTLMGQHMKFHAERSGTTFPVGPWDATSQISGEYANPQTGRSLAPQGGQPLGVTVYDPASGDPIAVRSAPLYSGDRILVLKYLYSFFPPQRFDVVVFKNPTDPAQNYIKRLLGLPNEEIALVDGDLFTRPVPSAGSPPSPAGPGTWAEPGWTIARKPALQQRTVWQTVFDSADAPLKSDPTRTPWTPAPAAQSRFTLTPRSYTFTGGGGGGGGPQDAPAELIFDQTKTRIANPGAPLAPRNETWSIDDYYFYNEHPAADARPPRVLSRMFARFPVSDLRVRLAATPAAESPDAEITLKLSIRGHDAELALSATAATIRWRPIVGAVGVKGDWVQLASAPITPLPPNRPTNIEFWHADQSFSIWLDGVRIAHADYDWSPDQRILFSTGASLASLMAQQPAEPANILQQSRLYTRPDVRLAFSGPSITLHRVALDRDLYYQPGTLPGGGQVAHATSPANPLALGPDEFFCCGDNSPASLDGRLWSDVDEWVDYEFRPTPTTPIRAGVVPRELMLGRAFFVYWPSLRYSARPIPVPDFGRMRFIW